MSHLITQEKFQAVSGTSSVRIMGEKLLSYQLGRIQVKGICHYGFTNCDFLQAVSGCHLRIQGKLGLSWLLPINSCALGLAEFL